MAKMSLSETGNVEFGRNGSLPNLNRSKLLRRSVCTLEYYFNKVKC